MTRALTSSIRKFHEDESGQDVLEFIMLIPFVLFIIFILFDFGLALDRYLAISHAVREGSRIAAVGADEATIRLNTIQQSQATLTGAASSCPAGDLVAPANACVEVTWNDGPDANTTAGQAGDGVVVRARYRYRIFNPFVSWMPFANITLGSCAASRLEVAPSAPDNNGWDCGS